MLRRKVRWNEEEEKEKEGVYADILYQQSFSLALIYNKKAKQIK